MELLAFLPNIIAQGDIIEEGVVNYIKWIRILAFLFCLICVIMASIAISKGSEGSEKAKYGFIGGALLGISVAIATYFFENSSEAELPSGLSL